MVFYKEKSLKLLGFLEEISEHVGTERWLLLSKERHLKGSVAEVPLSPHPIS